VVPREKPLVPGRCAMDEGFFKFKAVNNGRRR